MNAKDKKPDQFLAQTGPLLGLTLVVSLDQLFYMNGGQTQQAGARLVIHQNTQSKQRRFYLKSNFHHCHQMKFTSRLQQSYERKWGNEIVPLMFSDHCAL